MKCSCHDSPMYWNLDSRLRRGGFWECREKRKERNAKRVSMFGTRIYVPDGEFKQLAIALREERKESHGSTEI